MSDRFRPLERSLETVINIVSEKIGYYNAEKIKEMLTKYIEKIDHSSIEDSSNIVNDFIQEIILLHKNDKEFNDKLNLYKDDILEIKNKSFYILNEIYKNTNDIKKSYLGAYSFIIFNIHYMYVNSNWGIENPKIYIEDFSDEHGLIIFIRRSVKYLRNIIFSNTSNSKLIYSSAILGTLLLTFIKKIM